ncbi:hypothetical protein C3E79_04080 [Corynebacterium liangguodongii]|uniref:Uncharacterized protein n=2 Tax=Corynebacterium liangguodongii TaxID=2079535 RepID=A0A2S0WGY8_9CORY|nr:hypothetical protein C3E79_04080 [Corynebacterium liangguodongii]PWB99592.1 DUF4185 domain-containing protein [Corynebacterium liangguodongii]
MPGGYSVRMVRDLLGPTLTPHVGLRSGDLGVMAPLGNGEFAVVFGDSFRGVNLLGEWLSPVGVVATLADGTIQVERPLNAGAGVTQLIAYNRPTHNFTLTPSDIINIDGTLYMQGMWHHGLGNVDTTEIWASRDRGRTWRSVGATDPGYLGGVGNLISWERGPDGLIYVVSTSFTRSNPVYLSRFALPDITERTRWQLFDPSTGAWSRDGAPILSGGVKAGELNLRYIDGHWVLAMFNNETLQVEVRASTTLAREWDSVPTAVVAKHGPWENKQSPMNFSQPYGGYIVPGSTLADLNIVISQWNTADNSRYNATQFTVRGLDSFFGAAR